MNKVYLDLREAAVQIFCKVLGTVNAAMLTACAAETEHEAGEATLYVARDMCLCQRVYVAEKVEYFSVLFEKVYYRLIQSCEFLVLFISSGIVAAATVEDISAAIA